MTLRVELHVLAPDSSFLIRKQNNKRYLFKEAFKALAWYSRLIASSFFHHFYNTIQMTSQQYYLISVLRSNLLFDTPVSLLTLPSPLSGMTLSCPQQSLSHGTFQVSAQEAITYSMKPFMILHPLHGI